MEIKNTFFHRNKEYLITLTAIGILFFIICGAKQVFPFGSNTLDTIDFESQWVPVYYHVWDFLHGQGSLFFDWNVGGGNNFAGVSSQFSLISPFNLFFFFVKRSWIEKSMTFFILLKLAAMGITMCFYLKHNGRELQSHWLAAGSAAYALSGYSFLYYGMGWLDVAVIFPILLYNFVQMAEKERTWKIGKYALGYTLCLTIIFIMNIPQAYMTSFYLILFAGGYFFLLREEQTVNVGGILKFGLTTLLALGLSAVVFLPAALAMLGSFRLSGDEFSGVSGYFLLLRQTGMEVGSKWMMLAGVGIPFGYLIFTGKKSRRSFWQFYLPVMMAIPVFVEAVNLLWHRGTYVCFPMRYGYMMIFSVIAMAAERMGDREDEGRSAGFVQGRAGSIVAGLVLFAWGGLTLGMGLYLIDPLPHQGDVNFVSDAQELFGVFGEETDIFHKVKTADASLNNNYPLIAQVPSYSNYLHLMTTEQIMLERMLGYSQVWTRLGDTGGTLFSDALLGYQFTLSSRLTGLADEMSERGIYVPFSDTEHFVIFRNRYGYEPGLTVKKSVVDCLEQTVSENVFENQNLLSELFFDESFFYTWTEEFADVKENETLAYEIKVKGEGVVYLYAPNLLEASIAVNGNAVPVPGFDDPAGMTYPATYNNGVLALGNYEDENIRVEIEQKCNDTGMTKQVYFAILDMEQFEKSAQEERKTCSYEMTENSLHIQILSDGEEYLYLPINADSGWRCSVNGRETEAMRLCGNLMLVPLDAGENLVELQYVPRGQQKGMAVTLTAVLAMILWAAFSCVRGISEGIQKLYVPVSYLAAGIFFLLYAGFLLVIYVIPLGYMLYLRI